MANSTEYDVIINVITGHLEKATRQLRGMASEVDNVSTANRRNSKAQDEVNYKLNQGTIGASSAARSFSKLNQAIGSGPNGLVGAYATLAANAFAVSAAFTALREAAQVEQMMKGLEVQGARTGKNLAGLSKELQQLTNYSISAADAMQATALMSSAGFSSEGMKDLVTVANNAALALGRNVPDALDRISKGVTKLEPELLDELGIMTKLTEAQAAFALENNKSISSLTSFEKRQAMLNAVVAEGTAKFGGLSDQVEANPYDQLAATFSNLTKNVLGFANTVLGPIASIFGGSQGMLLGGVILFVSSIKKQLMPALFEMSKNALKAKEAHLEEAAAIREKTAETLKNAKAMRDSAVIEARSKVGSAGAALPKKFKIEGIKEGTLSVMELNEELKRLDSSIKARDIALEGKGPNPVSAEKRAQKEAELALVKEERKNLAALIDLEINGETKLLPLREEARKGRFEYIAATKLANADGLKAQALEAAAAGNLREGWQKAKEAAQEYRKAVAAQGKADRVGPDGTLEEQGLLSKLSERAAGIAGGAGIMAQTAAAGFMKFLPYIGMATTALSGAWSVYKNFIQSGTEKARIEALQKLKETLDNTAKSVKELNRLNELSIPLGLKAAQSMTIQSNATAEIAAGFEQVREASEAVKKGSNTTDSIWAVLVGSPEDAASYATGIAKGSKLLEPAIDELANSTAAYAGTAIGGAIGGFLGGLTGPLAPALIPAGATLGAMLGNKVGMVFAESLPEELNGIDEQALASTKAFYQLSKILDKDLFDGMTKAYGGMDEIAKSPAMQEQFIKDASVAYAGLADSIKELQESFKQADTAVQEFFTAAVPKTSFDGLVKGYQSVNEAIYSISKVPAANLNKQFELLTSMPESFSRLMSVSTQNVLQTSRNINVEVNAHKEKLEELNAQYEKADGLEKSALKTQIDKETSLISQLKTRQNALAESASTIKTELKGLEEQVSVYKAQEITNKNILTLHNAKMKVESEFYSLSAEGEARRIDMENRALDLQAAQLKAQKAMIDIYLAKLKATQSEINANISLLGIKQKISKEDQNQVFLAAQKDAQANKAAQLAALPKEQRAAWNTAADSIDRYVAKLADAAKDQASISRLMNIKTFTWSGGREVTEAEQSYFIAAKRAAIEGKRRDILETSEGIQKAIVDLDNSSKALAAEIAAIYASQVDEKTKEAKVAEAAAKVYGEQSALAQQLQDATTKNKILEEDINDLLAGRKQLITANLRNTLAEYATQLSSAKQAKERDRANQQATINVLKAKSKGSEMEIAGIKNLETTLDLNMRIHDEAIRQLDIKVQQTMYEALLGNGIEDSIGKLQSVISLEQKRLDLVTETIDKQSKIAQGKSEVAILSTGGTVNEKTQKQFAVESAAIAYQAAKDGYDLQIKAIDAEYDLLDVKKKVDEANLKAQSLMIRSLWGVFNKDTMSEEMKKNLSAIETAALGIQNVDTKSMRELAKRSAGQDVELARIALQKTIAERDNIGKVANPILNAFENFQAREQSRAREIAALAGTNKESVPKTQLSFNDKQIKAAEEQVTNLIAIRENTKPAAVAEAIASALAPTTAKSAADTTKLANSIRTDLVTALGTVGDPYGSRDGAHTGVDIEMNAGTAVPATVEGRLSFDTNKKGGYQAFITAANGVRVGYAHLSEQYKNLEGKIVKVGDIIGKSGGAPGTPGAGRTTGAHLHYSVTVNGEKINPLKPVVLDIATNTGGEPISTIQTAATESVTDAQKQQASGIVSASAAAAQENVNDIGITAPTKLLDKMPSKVESTMELIADVFDSMTTKIMDLGSQMAERLGYDFGPQGKILTSINQLMQSLVPMYNSFNKSFKAIGEGWKIMNAGMKTESTDTAATVSANQSTLVQKNEEVNKSNEKTKAGFSTMMKGASDALNGIASLIGAVAAISKASSDAKIANIDKEIAAEQKRDGKSAASLAKIDSLEKKKDAMARKQFNTQKKLMMAQAVMQTAAAVTGALSLLPNPMAIPLAAIAGAMGLAQVAIIASTQYESSYSPKSVETPSSLSIGKRSDSVDLARGPNANAGGEVGYVRGAAGTGTNASNYRTIGSAYGGELMRGYGNRGFVVGEKGPEIITPETPITVTPANDVGQAQAVNATINIQALDSQGVQDVLVAQKGNIIKMLRQAANASGKSFMEDVNVNVYTRPNVGKL